MLKRAVRFLARRVIPEELNPAPAPMPPPAAEPSSPALDPGIDDAQLSGWFNYETGELFEGFAITSADTVVDIGCGDGGNSLFCADMGAKVIFVDINAASVAQTASALRAHGHTDAPGLVSDANPLPLASASATHVVCTEVLEHVDSTAPFLGELVRIGKPGAKYLLTVPDPVAEQLQTHFAPASYFEHPNHIRIVGRDEFSAMVEAAGLIIEKQTAFGFYWSMWWMLFWGCEKQDLAPPWHPILQNWMNTWAHFLKTPNGPRIKRILDSHLPKSQLIIARKPAASDQQSGAS
jgi:SAM-dependent methyltransferase